MSQEKTTALKDRKEYYKNYQKRVQHFLDTGEYTKPNGKVNISALAKAINMNRKTVAKYL